MESLLSRHPWMPYVVPFAAFLGMLLLGPLLPLSPAVEGIVRVTVLAWVTWLFARPVLSLRMTRPVATIGLGIVVFVLWIAPDQLFPGYRDSILFQNSITGQVASSMSIEARNDVIALICRFARATLIVPIVEELFWRGWLVRWIDDPEDFRNRPLGRFTQFSFLSVAVVFAVQHGAYWDVGLLTGFIYNWWMIRTKSLGDLIWCHGVTNGCLSIWVLATGQWQYW